MHRIRSWAVRPGMRRESKLHSVSGQMIKVEARVIGGCSLACISTGDGLRETGLTRNAIAFEHERRTVS